MVIIAQEEEGRSEDWISCLNPWLWEVRVAAQVREVVTERVVRANGLACNKVSEGSVDVSWMQRHHQEYFKEADALPIHQDFVVTLGGTWGVLVWLPDQI